MPAHHVWQPVTGVQEVNGALQGVWEVPEFRAPEFRAACPIAAETKLGVPALSSEAATAPLGEEMKRRQILFLT